MASTIALSKTAAALYTVKLVWRNPVMHPKESYGEAEAQEVLQHVKVFMEHLASII